jgi:hypothetical protein
MKSGLLSAMIRGERGLRSVYIVEIKGRLGVDYRIP